MNPQHPTLLGAWQRLVMQYAVIAMTFNEYDTNERSKARIKEDLDNMRQSLEVLGELINGLSSEEAEHEH